MIINRGQQQNIQIGSSALIRKGSMSWKEMDKLYFSETVNYIEDYIRLEDWCLEHKKQICDLVFIAVKEVSNNEDRRVLIQLKRDVFNDRLPKFNLEILQHLIAEFNDNDKKLIEQWYIYMNKRKELIDKGEGVLLNEYQSKKISLKEMCTDELFENGLAVASMSLYKKWQSEKKDYVSGTHRLGKYRKLENALVSYLSRMSTKTSPFSTFNKVFSAFFGSERDDGELVGMHQMFVNANHALIHRFITYLEQHESIIPHLPLRTNKLRWEENGQLSFIVRRDNLGSAHKVIKNYEQLLTTKNTETFKQLLEIIDSSPEGITYEQVINMLSNNNAQENRVKQMLEKIINMGIIERSIPLPDQEYDALEWLIAYLNGISDDFASTFCLLLKKLHLNIQKVTNQTASEKKETILVINRLVRECFIMLGSEKEPSWSNNIFYEDFIKAKRAPQKNAIAKERWEKAVKDLVIIDKIGSLFDESIYHRESIFYFYKHVLKGKDMSLLSLYRYYLQVTKNYPTYAEGRFPFFLFNPFQIERLEQLSTLTKEFIEKYNELQLENKEIDLTDDWVENILDKMPRLEKRPFMYSIYSQPLILENGEDGLVVNGVFPGPPKPFIRYSKYLPDTQPMIKELLNLYEDDQKKTAEITASFGLNANIHPNFTTYQLRYGQLDESEIKVELVDLFVRLGEDEAIHLYSKKTGEEIVPLDLGMMYAGYQPPLYRFLNQFFGGDYFPFSLLNYEKYSKDTLHHIVQKPRVRAGNVILDRKKWLISIDDIPKKKSTDTDFLYFLKTRQWIKEKGIPEVVFVRSKQLEELYVNELQEDFDEQKKKRVGAASKPQYINFGSYFFINLFQRAIHMCQSYMQIEEILPSTDDLKQNGLDYVEEWVFQLYKEKEENS